MKTSSAISPQMEVYLRQGFRYFNRFMILMWRLGLGTWLNAGPQMGGRYMVITHTGRKSGARRRTPVNYALVDGEIYCAAGFGKASDWYRNIKADPSVEVWLADGWWAGTAEDVAESSGRIRLMREVLVASGFAAYAAGVDPVKMTDEQLASVTADYCLIRIRRTTPRTGMDGPGDLAWVWPAVTFVLLGMWLLRGRKR